MSDLTINIIAFKKGFIVSDGTPASKQIQMSIQAELMQFGYMLTEDALESVTVRWFEEILPYIKKSLGADRNYTPFYKNFPQEVMELSHVELFYNAILHYISNGNWEPSEVLEDRGYKFEEVKYNLIKLGSSDDFENIFTKLVSINMSLTEDDKNIVEWFCENYSNNLKMPNNVPFKETLCLLASYKLDVPVKTPTDVLRICVQLSGGDISLPAIPKILTPIPDKDNWASRFLENRRSAEITARDKFKFKKFSRSERKYILSLLEKTNLDVSEMKLKIGRWIRLGEILHVGEYKSRFPKTYVAFNLLRNNPDSIKTFYSKFNSLLEEDVQKAINFLSTRPGEFARKLDWLVRTQDSNLVLKSFRLISDKVSRKVIWELYNHFLNRNELTTRTIMIKGKRAIQKVLPSLEPMSNDTIKEINETLFKVIGDQIANEVSLGNLNELGKTYIDPKLQNIPLPFAMRSINSSVKTYVRGTRIPFSSTAKVIRPYIHWYDQDGVEDLDISAGFYSENLKLIDHLSYTNLKNDVLNSCHSGDIRHRKGSCAEYVDIDIKTCLNNKVRYVIIQVHNFESRPMHTMDECVFGLTEREFPQSGKLFKPDTISNAVKLGNESSTVNVCALDLLEREYIWLDMESQSRGLSNFESTSNSTFKLLDGIIKKRFISVYDLLLIHSNVRSESVVNYPNNADTVFMFDDFVASYDTIATYM